MDSWAELPLFPGMVLPLRIFEERYKLMINRCLEETRPFGVVLIREGKEVGGGPVPYRVGTTALIAGLNRLDEGQMKMVTIGGDRFRLHAFRHGLPYLVGQAEPWPLTGGDPEQAQKIVAPVRAPLAEYVGLIAQAQGIEVKIEDTLSDPASLALLVAVTLKLPMPQKQELLTQPTVADMLAAERTLLHREKLLLDHIIQTQTEQWERGFSGFLAKN